MDSQIQTDLNLVRLKLFHRQQDFYINLKFVKNLKTVTNNPILLRYLNIQS